jgi:hypothetical protein
MLTLWAYVRYVGRSGVEVASDTSRTVPTRHPPPATRHFFTVGAVVFRVGSDVQADAGDAAAGAAAAGLLAAGSGSRAKKNSLRETLNQWLNLLVEKLPCSDWPSHRVWSRFLPRRSAPAVRADFPALARGQCLDLLCGLFGPDVLAVGSGGFIPVYGRGRWGFRKWCCHWFAGRHFHGRFCPASSSPLFFDRLAVVSHHAGAGDRDCSGGSRRGRIVTRICRRSACICC